jgi:hypothetical protein
VFGEKRSVQCVYDFYSMDNRLLYLDNKNNAIEVGKESMRTYTYI